MSGPGLSKAILISPGQSETLASEISTTSPSFELGRVKFEHDIDVHLVRLQRDAHNKRIKSLRKELDYLQSTAWKYQSTDNHLWQ